LSEQQNGNYTEVRDRGLIGKFSSVFSRRDWSKLTVQSCHNTFSM